MKNLKNGHKPNEIDITSNTNQKINNTTEKITHAIPQTRLRQSIGRQNRKW